MLHGNILITGGTGTLGHAICRQARRESWPCTFTIMARSELGLARMRSRFPEHRFVLGDIRSVESVELIAARHQGIIHAAAMKRIPECEERPDECIWTNVHGSGNVLKAAMLHNTSWILGISTDKACNAATVYGASKLMMEGLWSATALRVGSTQPVLVRYGNVVASNGSVIPTWRRAVEEGKPITITHENMSRFWMSPTDAVRLIVRAVENRDVWGHTIMVPKAKAMSVVDLARGLYPDAQIEVTGLRSAEKIHEDLVAKTEHYVDIGDAYYVFPRGGQSAGAELGFSFTSYNAQALTLSEFQSMLADAEDLERLMQS